jgi:OOP family OmpA-OmpF porin
MMASRCPVLLIALAISVGVANGAAAQPSVDPVTPWPGAPGRNGPTQDEIINSLTPHGGHYARGIRPGDASRASASASLTIGFPSGSARLTNEARATLDGVGKILAERASAGDRFLIEGHSDTVGNQAANLALSQRRAEAVTQYLESKFGIAADRLETIGVGPDHLLVATTDRTPEARNRRVSITIIAPPPTPASPVQPQARP